MVPYGIGGEIQKFPLKYKVTLIVTDPNVNMKNISEYIKNILSMYSDLIINEPQLQGNTISFEVGSVVPRISKVDIEQRIKTYISFFNDPHVKINPNSVRVENTQYYNNILKILSVIANLVDYDKNISAMDQGIIQQIGIPREDVQHYLNDMEYMGLIKKVRPKPLGTSIHLYNITDEGLQELSKVYRN